MSGDVVGELLRADGDVPRVRMHPKRSSGDDNREAITEELAVTEELTHGEGRRTLHQ